MYQRCLLLLLALFAGTASAQESACPSRLFVSGYFSTVHIYDACTGAFLRNLDTRTRLNGAQAMRVGPDGLLYVVAESARAIHKYRPDTLEYVGLFASTPAMGPLGIDFAADGSVYVAGYDSNDVKKYDSSGVLIGAAFAAGASGISGPEIGTMFGPDGNLYVPGYNSHNVIRLDPRTGQTSVVVAPRAGGIFRPRGLLLDKDGQSFLLAVEGTGQLMRLRIADGNLSEFARGLSGSTMVAYAPDGKLLVVHDGGVARLDPLTGTNLGTLVAAGSGGLSGPTFIAVLPNSNTRTPDRSQIGTQYWVVGNSSFAGNVLSVPDVFSATGSAFGPDLRFSDLAVKRWGSVRIEFVSCNRAQFSWDSTGPGSADFGSGAYEISRFFVNEATDRCLQQGIAAADKSWVNGHWWGGDSRSGEGMFLDRRADGAAFFAWFTHRPR